MNDEYSYTPDTEPDADACQFRHHEGFCENDEVVGYIEITDDMPGFDASGFWVPGCPVHVEQDELPLGATVQHPKALARDLQT